MDVSAHCQRCAAPRSRFVRDGFDYRTDDSKSIQRYKCTLCAKKFSSATFKPTYRQKKRCINYRVRFCLASNMCPRDIAERADVNIKTVAARLVWQVKQSRKKNAFFLQASVEQHGRIDCVQFDDLITFEHTKCKPLTVPIAVVDGMRVPLYFRVASIQAFGLSASISREKYGKRVDARRRERCKLFRKLVELLPPDVTFKTDGHEHYATLIKKFFPDATHEVFRSVRVRLSDKLN